MPAKARLNDIVDTPLVQVDEYLSFLDLDSGELVSVSRELLHAVEQEDDPGFLSKWQEPEWESAQQIASTDRFRRLPTKFDVHEWAIMEQFADSVRSEQVRDELMRGLHRWGAFGNFKDGVRRAGIEKAWFAYKVDALREIAEK